MLVHSSHLLNIHVLHSAVAGAVGYIFLSFCSFPHQLVQRARHYVPFRQNYHLLLHEKYNRSDQETADV